MRKLKIVYNTSGEEFPEGYDEHFGLKELCELYKGWSTAEFDSQEELKGFLRGLREITDRKPSHDIIHTGEDITELLRVTHKALEGDEPELQGLLTHAKYLYFVSDDHMLTVGPMVGYAEKARYELWQILSKTVFELPF